MVPCAPWRRAPWPDVLQAILYGMLGRRLRLALTVLAITFGVMLAVTLTIGNLTANDIAGCADALPDCALPQNFPVLGAGSSWGSNGTVILRLRIAEIHKDAITEILRYVASLLFNGFRTYLLVGNHHVEEFFRIKCFRKSS